MQRVITRPYRLEDLKRFRVSPQTQWISYPLADKLYRLLGEHQKQKTASITYGLMDPVQLIQASPYIDTVYVSGWTCASTASSNNEPGPDFADYPSTTVPNKVEQFLRAQEHHQRRLQITGAKVDMLKPIIADADTGFGGLTSVMKTTKMMIQSGAAGIHLEDQRNDAKRCGHLGGKVLVSTQTHIDRLVAARLQVDLLNPSQQNDGLVIISRTDAESATYLDSNIDQRDHPFIIGKVVTPYWTGEMTLLEAIQKLGKEGQKWNPRKMRFDMEILRSREGFYRVRGSTEYAIARSLAFSPYADMLWCETSKPCLTQARTISNGILKRYPGKMLAYNLSPSFKWSKSGLSLRERRDFSLRLGHFGFNWHFVTLLGYHVNGLAMTRFARDFIMNGMEAYSSRIQDAEEQENVSTFKHQQWSGVELVDELLSLITSDKGRQGQARAADKSTERSF